MAYNKKYNKTIQKDAKTPDHAIIRILSGGTIAQPEIQKMIKKKPYSIELTRMGLWKILDRLEKKGEIEKKFLDGVYVYNVSPKSKILAEVLGVTFQVLFKSKMKIADSQENIFEEFGSKDNPVDALLKYFGFYVLGSMLASRMIKDKKQRTYWLKVVLDLEKRQPISEIFEDWIGHNEETTKNLILALRQKYKKNMAVLGHSCIETLKVREFKHSNEFKMFIDNWNEDKPLHQGLKIND